MIKKLEWLDGYRTGHPEIDSDHRKLVDTVNDIAAKFAGGLGQEAYRDCIRFRAECRQHFELENRLLREMDFPRTADHIESHGAFEAYLAAYCAACGERCRKSQEERCLSDLTAMLIDHLVRGDLDFKSHIEEHGLGRE